MALEENDKQHSARQVKLTIEEMYRMYTESNMVAELVNPQGVQATASDELSSKDQKEEAVVKQLVTAGELTRSAGEEAVGSQPADEQHPVESLVKPQE